MRIRPLDEVADWLVRMPKAHPFWSVVLWLLVIVSWLGYFQMR